MFNKKTTTTKYKAIFRYVTQRANTDNIHTNDIVLTKETSIQFGLSLKLSKDLKTKIKGKRNRVLTYVEASWKTSQTAVSHAKESLQRSCDQW